MTPKRQPLKRKTFAALSPSLRLYVVQYYGYAYCEWGKGNSSLDDEKFQRMCRAWDRLEAYISGVDYDA